MSTNPNPKKKSAQTRPMTAPLPKKGTTGRLKKGTKPLKKKKKQGLGVMAQVIGGVTLVGLLGGLAAVGIYVADTQLKKAEAPVPVAGGVPRPSIKPTLDGLETRRPGMAASPEDEVYERKATDVAKTPFEPPVQGLLLKEVLTVFADGKFRPTMPVTRAEFVNWCYNAVMAQTVRGADPFAPTKKAFTSVEATGEEFTDVPAEHWASNVLATLKGAGLIDGKAFRPDAALTREDWAVFVTQFAAPMAAKEALKAPLDAKKAQIAYRVRNFTDFDALKPASRPYVHFVLSDPARARWLDEAFTLPEAPGPWGPAKPVTRGEAAAWIGGVYEQIGKDIF
jgi:S-layer homology domain